MNISVKRVTSLAASALLMTAAASLSLFSGVASALGGANAGVALVPSPDQNGYAIISAAGGQYNYGSSKFTGSLAGQTLNAPIVDATAVPGAGDAKWFAASDGGVFTEGAGAQFYGSMGGKPLNAPVTAIVPSHSGHGYLLVAQDGGTFAFGDFPPTRSLAGTHLNAPIVDAISTADDRGVWLTAADGGVFAFGAAQFYGSLGGTRLNAPVTAILASPSNHGYLLVAQDGGTFAFGDFPFPGSLAGIKLNAPVVDAAPALQTQGVWLLGSDGGIFTLSAPFYGAATGQANPPPPATYPGTVSGTTGGLVNVACPTGGSITVAAPIGKNVSDLLTAARANGHSLCGSGWRNTDRQIALRKQNCGGNTHYAIWEAPSSSCRPPTAIPGASMHEKGLAIDFSSPNQSGYDWLKKNAPTYGLHLLVDGTERWHFSTNGH
jgi:hypothetical protein